MEHGLLVCSHTSKLMSALSVFLSSQAQDSVFLGLEHEFVFTTNKTQEDKEGQGAEGAGAQ